MIQMQEVKHRRQVFKLPSFGVIWTLRSDEASNDKGTWNSWKIGGRHGYVEDKIFTKIHVKNSPQWLRMAQPRLPMIRIWMPIRVIAVRLSRSRRNDGGRVLVS